MSLLQECKYYLGTTYNNKFNFEKYFYKPQPQWTLKYKPIKIQQILKNCKESDIHYFTSLYISNYGICNVRNQYYSDIELSKQFKKKYKNKKNNLIDCDNNFCEYCGDICNYTYSSS